MGRPTAVSKSIQQQQQQQRRKQTSNHRLFLLRAWPLAPAYKSFDGPLGMAVSSRMAILPKLTQCPHLLIAWDLGLESLQQRAIQHRSGARNHLQPASQGEGVGGVTHSTWTHRSTTCIHKADMSTCNLHPPPKIDTSRSVPCT